MRDPHSRNRKNVLHLAVMMVAAASSVGVVMLLALYHAAVERERTHLMDIIRVQQRLMQAHFGANYSGSGVAGTTLGATHAEILESHASGDGFGQTGEILLGQRRGAGIHLLWPLRLVPHAERLRPYDSADMEPMRRALAGMTGEAQLSDYRNEPTVVAYAPVAGFDLGIVAKIDLKELEVPFVHAGLLGGAVSVVMIGSATFLSTRIGRRLAIQSEESERRLKTLMANLPGMAYRCRNDSHWTMEFVSEGGEELTGYPAEDLIDNTVVAYADLIHPDDREKVWDTVQAALIERRSFRMYYRIRCADAREKWVWEQGVGVFESGDLKALEGFITDVTERERAENELSAMFKRVRRHHAAIVQLATNEAVGSGDFKQAVRTITAITTEALTVARASIWLLSQDGKTLRCQDLYESPYDRHTEGMLLHVEDYPRYFAALKSLRAIDAHDAKTDPRTAEFRDKYLVPLGIEAMLDAAIRVAGRTVGVVCIEHIGEARQWTADEITCAGQVSDQVAQALIQQERRRAQDALSKMHAELEVKVEERTLALSKANEQLKELDKLKSMFIASMSHELRTPLNAIIGFTGILLQGMSGELNAEQKAQLGRVYGAGKHLLALISDVIDISKIEAGYIDVYLETFEIQTVIDEAIVHIAPMVKEKNLNLQSTPVHGIAITTDRKRLFQCILNLLSNAVKYTEEGTISVQTEHTDRTIRIQVSDTGIGIDGQAMQKLFQPFERIESHLRIQTPGTGLGLYLTRKITEEILHGGISAESEIGRGSRFLLCLPTTIAPKQSVA